MTITPITTTRQRLRAVRNRQPAPPPPALPYRWTWVTDGSGLWTLVVRVRATGQQIRCSYRTTVKPSDADGERIARRLYVSFAKGVGR